MSLPDDQQLLPPFGIRDLHGPSTETGLIKISGPEYDATIRSQPDALLSYLDDDDGEEIMVGSSFELKQRLDDPAPQYNIQQINGDREDTENLSANKGIHVFDIHHTSGSLAVWKEHEAYSSKRMRKVPEPQIKDEDTDLYSGDISKSPPREDNDAVLKMEDSDLDVNSSKNFQLHVDESNDDRLLPSPSDIHRLEYVKAILGDTKSSQSDGSWISFISSSSIKPLPTSSHADGSDPLQNRDCPSSHNPGREAEPNSNIPQYASETSHPVQESVSTAVDVESIVLEALQGLDTHVTRFADLLEVTASILRDMVQKDEETNSTPANKVFDGFRSILTEVGRFGLDVLRNLDSTSSSSVKASSTTRSVTLADVQTPSSSTQGSMKTEEVLSTRPSVSAMPLGDMKLGLVSKAVDSSVTRAASGNAFPQPILSGSILDLDNPDSDFSARYPPLSSFRSIDEMKKITQKQKTSSSPSRNTLRRYRSLAQFSEKTHQATSRADQINIADIRYPSIITESRLNDAKPRITNIKSFPNLKTQIKDELGDLPDLEKGYHHNIEQRPESNFHSITGSSARIPGSWPENQVEIFSSISNHAGESAVESSVAIGDQTFSGPPASTSKFSEQSNPSQKPHTHPGFPSNNLHRARTVHFTNPAARLITPFDPFGNASSSTKPHNMDNLYHPGNLDFTGHADNVQTSQALPLRTRSLHNPWNRPQTRHAYTRPLGWFDDTNNRSPPLPQLFSHSRPPTLRQNPSPNTVLRHRHEVENEGPARVSPGRPETQDIDYANFIPNPSGHESTISQPTAQNPVHQCVRELREMGFGMQDPIEMSRLDMYASAAAGDVMEAIELIEEDRKAGQELRNN